MIITLRRPGGAPSVIHCTWDQLVDFFKANAATTAFTREPQTGDVPGIMFAESPAGFGLQEVEASPGLWAMAWDFDDVPQVAFERALIQIKAAGFKRGLAHTTWSFGLPGVWTIENPVRARVIAPFDEPIPPRLWRDVWERCAGIASSVGAVPDGQCKNINRWYYLPVTNAAAPDWAKPCWIESWSE